MSFWNNRDAKPIIGEKGVKYGLQTFSKPKDASSSKSKLAAFGEDVEHDVGDINAARRAQTGARRSDAKYDKMHAAALAEDPGVYDYDSFYDGIQAEREAEKLAAHAREKSGPQYIHALQAAKQQREREQNIIYERRLERDRKVEDALHGDKEVFISNAYKRKLLEDKLWQANQDAKDERDAKNSARARGNMDGMLNLLSSAMQEPAAQPQDDAGHGSEGEMEAREEPNNESGSRQGGANLLQADLQKRAEVKIQKAVEDMDKYELARYRAEQRLRERSARMQAEHSGDDAGGGGAALAEGRTDAHGASEGERAPGVMSGDGANAAAPPGHADEGVGASDKGTLKRRAGEAEISAARERYLARKNARREGGASVT